MLLYSFVPTQAYHILRDDTAEWVLGVPHSKYKHKNNYYQAVAIYEKAYDKSQIHVTPIVGSDLMSPSRMSGVLWTGIVMTRRVLGPWRTKCESGSRKRG